jgi:benzoate membrane transport protein
MSENASIRAGRDWAQPVAAGVTASVVGFGGSFAVVLTGLHAVGASDAQAASGLLALSVAMGALTVWISLRTREPISIVWSTPGAAILASAGAVVGGYRAALGAFVVAGLLIAATGASARLTGLIKKIPAQLVAALLAGVLLPLCTAPVRAITQLPWQAGTIAVCWAAASRLWPRWAVPVALLVMGAVVAADPSAHAGHIGGLIPRLDAALPQFSVGAVAGIAVPLYVVTMASQNLPGLGVLHANGYEPPMRRILGMTGVGTMATAPFGGIALNLSALTAAMVAGPAAHRDSARRWIAAVASGCAYIALGLAAGLAVALAAVASPLLVAEVAGLALLGALVGALNTAISGERFREAAVVTFVVTASGVQVAGISSPIWGLAAGLAFVALRYQRPAPQPAPASAGLEYQIPQQLTGARGDGAGHGVPVQPRRG